jgi:hydrogenase maturation protease
MALATHQTADSSFAGILIVGYGNSLRGDDDLGPYIVRQMARRDWPGLCTKVVLQLAPELAEELAHADFVIFVDARMAPRGQVSVEAVSEAAPCEGLTHVAAVETLLRLARSAFGRSPRAWVVGVPGSDFSFREKISSTGQANACLAMQRIEELLRTLGPKATRHRQRLGRVRR